ncbi:hypothetical protein JDV02_010170 [Purpureocillium takamizusanense]|uniref:Uncharacterized protein n=1 Tax=Purpureocillium takamizusanense TaxID=2060973 RepID=A0A9Q8VGD4_9HYPO|nr:uncharacterized protein JDV02_010170 [Purpureocillium takamizusanense]UNI24426.1 hypothetical protein JDV02_010170 [Purpureocillium takamizusanense]
MRPDVMCLPRNLQNDRSSVKLMACMLTTHTLLRVRQPAVRTALANMREPLAGKVWVVPSRKKADFERRGSDRNVPKHTGSVVVDEGHDRPYLRHGLGAKPGVSTKRKESAERAHQTCVIRHVGVEVPLTLGLAG